MHLVFVSTSFHCLHLQGCATARVVLARSVDLTRTHQGSMQLKGLSAQLPKESNAPDVHFLP